MKLLGKLICKLHKHKRGIRTGVSSVLGIQFQCPRCNKVWNRKVKNASNTTPA